MDWPELHEILGATRGVHRQTDGKILGENRRPEQSLGPLRFMGRSSNIRTEFFRFVTPPYSREKLHVLLSMDVARTDMNQGMPFIAGQTITSRLGLCRKLDSQLWQRSSLLLHPWA